MVNNEGPTEVMTIRIPRDIVNTIRQLKKEKNLSTLGTALRVYLEKMQNEQIESKLIQIEERAEKTESHLRTLMKEFLFLEARTLMNHVIIQGKMLPPEEPRLPLPPKLPEHLVADLRDVKKNLETLGLTDSWYYKMARAHIYMSGDRQEDITPEMKAAFEEWCNDIAAHKQRLKAQKDQNMTKRSTRKISEEHVN